MFRILFLTIVTLSFASIVHAGLDTFNCECELITAFRFESTKANEDLTTYTEDSGPQGHTGSLLNGASLSNDGKYGKCLHLRGDAIFGSGTTIVPLAGNYEFSIAAWIKLPRQRHSSFKLYVKGEHTDDDSIINFHLLVVKTDGNLLGVHDAGEDTDFSIETNDQNVSDNEWHHIVYCHRKFRPLSNIRLCYNDPLFERSIPMAKRRRFTPKFKAEVVLEALHGESSQAELCRRHNLSENQVSTWKRQLLENVETFFESADKPSSESTERIAQLEQLVGRLTLALEIQKKASTLLD